MKNEMRARWMVVDNEAETLAVLADLLAAVSDAEICAFRSPWQALDAFANEPESFEFVITDFDMPGMNGSDLKRHLHALAPGVKVLLTTGSGLFTEEAAVSSGFCGLLLKPFSITTLKQTLEAANALTPALSHPMGEGEVVPAFGLIHPHLGGDGSLNLL
jgi:two-component system cell cycle sensor histidine kinase/response regulator CckA